MALFGLLFGTSTLVTGVEPGPGDSLKVYVGARFRGIYFLVDDPAEKERVERAWSDRSAHVVIETPPAEILRRDDA